MYTSVYLFVYISMYANTWAIHIIAPLMFMSCLIRLSSNLNNSCVYFPWNSEKLKRIINYRNEKGHRVNLRYVRDLPYLNLETYGKETTDDEYENYSWKVWSLELGLSTVFLWPLDTEWDLGK